MNKKFCFVILPGIYCSESLKIQEKSTVDKKDLLREKALAKYIAYEAKQKQKKQKSHSKEQ